MDATKYFQGFPVEGCESFFFSLAKVVSDKWDECLAVRTAFFLWRLCNFGCAMSLFRRDTI
jgi:hypothetical protein